MSLDRIDRKILDRLQTDGRVTNRELASRINLSATPCLNRVKRLENDGTIVGYEARVNPKAAGLQISALVLLRIGSNTREAGDKFAAAIAKISAITECYMTAGQLDYVARVYAKDLDDYERILKDELGSLPGITGMESLFVLNEIIPRRKISFSD